MKFKSVFDIIGPIMVGPSSSHTAGAARIGLAARSLFGETPDHVDIYLFGSFKDTYKGHGTDVALLGGLLGFDTDDSRIIKAKEYAEEAGMHYQFIELEETRSHPNTAILFLRKGDSRISVEGISIGGGKMEIVSIDEYNINISGNNPALLVFHKDTFGTIGRITTIIGDEGINVAQMNVSRKEKGNTALMTIEVDEVVSEETINKIEGGDGVQRVFLMDES